MWERGVQRSPSLHPPLPSLVVSGVPGLGLSLPQVEVYRQPSRRWEEGGGGVASLLARVKPHRGEGVRVHRSKSLVLPLKGERRQALHLAHLDNHEEAERRSGEGEKRGLRSSRSKVQNLQNEVVEPCDNVRIREKLRRVSSLPSIKQRGRTAKVRLAMAKLLLTSL